MEMMVHALVSKLLSGNLLSLQPKFFCMLLFRKCLRDGTMLVPVPTSFTANGEVVQSLQIEINED